MMTLEAWRAMTPEARLLSRLDVGAGEPCLFLPFVGEFGHEIMSHVRLVHFHRAARKVVCCRPGNEALYPSADAFVTDWRDPVRDAVRVGTGRGGGRRATEWAGIRARFPGHRAIHAGGLSPVQELIHVRPGEAVPFAPRRRGLRAEVVLGVRRRAFATYRNWPHWHDVARVLDGAGVTFAVVGARETSFDLPGQAVHTGDLDSDAAIELLQTCRLYVGTDSGGSHLAAAARAPMLVFREGESGDRDLTWRMAAENPCGVEVLADGWSDPGRVIRRIIERLATDGPRG